MEKRGDLYVLTGPSGSGKTTILNNLCQDLYVQKVLSCTTRMPRQKEQAGKDYNFVSPAEFTKLEEAGELVAEVKLGTHSYGTPKSEILTTRQGCDKIWVIDMLTAAYLRELIGSSFASDQAQEINAHLTTIFIGIPNLLTLKNRFFDRGGQAKDFLERMKREWQIWQNNRHRYDHVVINYPGKLNQTVSEIRQIMEGKN